MGREPHLSEETVYLRLNDLAYEVWFNSWIKVNITSKELAMSFGKEVVLKNFDWEDCDQNRKEGG